MCIFIPDFSHKLLTHVCSFLLGIFTGMSNQHCRINMYKLNCETASRPTPHNLLYLNNNFILPLSQGTEHPYQDILLALPSKYFQNLITSQMSRSYHLGLSYQYFLPGLLPQPPNCLLASTLALLQSVLKIAARVILLKQLRSHLSKPSHKLSISVHTLEFLQWPGRPYIVYLQFFLPLTQFVSPWCSWDILLPQGFFSFCTECSFPDISALLTLLPPLDLCSNDKFSLRTFLDYFILNVYSLTCWVFISHPCGVIFLYSFYNHVIFYLHIYFLFFSSNRM